MGRFVVLEGLDGSGTTTQAARLAAAMRADGATVTVTGEPADSPVGRLIRAALRGESDAVALSTMPWMFAADRSDHLSRVVEPALARGETVISDRYLPSSLAYQSIDRPLAQVDALNRWFRVPDVTVFLDVPVDECLRRIGARGELREVFEERDTLRTIAARYEAVFEHLDARGWYVVRLDGTLSPDAVAAAVVEAVCAP